MQPFITVVIMCRNPEKPLHQFVCIRESLFNLTWILDNSKDVIAFEVSENGNKVTPKHYGWGSFSKWVTEFTREMWDRI